jgi:hypothetical protein
MRKRGEKTVTPTLSSEAVPGLSRTELDYLFSVTYEELRRLAASVKRSDRASTL